jgi:hypothetical protein
VQALYEDLLNLAELRGVRINFLERVTNAGTLQFGLRFAIGSASLRGMLDTLCDRLDTIPIELLISLYIDTMTLQVKTRDPEELAATIQAAELLLPPRRTFLAKAETYARRYGEFTPAEKANLDWLQQQLAIPPEEINQLLAKALGPYRSRREKRDRYRDVLVAELSHQFPPTEEIRTTLREFATNLRLPLEDEAVLYNEVMRDMQATVEAKRQQQEGEAAKTHLQEITRLQMALDQQEAADKQTHLGQYREEFSKAIASNFRPLEFDQGRLEQARRIWKISSEEATQIEVEETARRYGSIDSGVGADYSRLRELLYLGDWQAADIATEQALLYAATVAAGQGIPGQPLEDLRIIDTENLRQIPCQDLLTVDQLWRLYSNNKFGFQAQVQVYTAMAGQQPQDFLSLVGWRSGGGFLQKPRPYRELTFNLTAPDGHLPSWRWACASLEAGYTVSDELVETFLAYLVNPCHILPDSNALSPDQ